MKKWIVTFQVDATVYVEVDAVNKERAMERAWEQVAVPGLCHQCSHQIDLGDPIEILEAEEKK